MWMEHEVLWEKVVFDIVGTWTECSEMVEYATGLVSFGKAVIEPCTYDPAPDPGGYEAVIMLDHNDAVQFKLRWS